MKIESKEKIEIPKELFENVFHFFSAMRLFPEIFSFMDKEKFFNYYSDLSKIYDLHNP